MLCFNCFFFSFLFFCSLTKNTTGIGTGHDLTLLAFFPSENFFFLNIQLSALALETWEADIAQSMLPY